MHHTKRRSTVAAIADRIGGYQRLACPHCDLTIRLRGVAAEEADTYRDYMTDHIRSHRNS